mmetsp:Transcript_36820/g.72411  ORF Transcript_36820/g.72411 Transcript_36820/m.72411 type:complete len:254 (+) Transcript_36820:809-1570(+)
MQSKCDTMWGFGTSTRPGGSAPRSRRTLPNRLVSKIPGREWCRNRSVVNFCGSGPPGGVPAWTAAAEDSAFPKRRRGILTHPAAHGSARAGDDDDDDDVCATNSSTVVGAPRWGRASRDDASRPSPPVVFHPSLHPELSFSPLCPRCRRLNATNSSESRKTAHPGGSPPLSRSNPSRSASAHLPKKKRCRSSCNLRPSRTCDLRRRAGMKSASPHSVTRTRPEAFHRPSISEGEDALVGSTATTSRRRGRIVW